jgi:hypothetical protein
MQLFILDRDPVKAARYACDKHVVKICTEAGQILATALHGRGIITQWKPTHKGHPLSKWVDTRHHAEWTKAYGIALCVEYQERYNKRHKTQDFLESLDLSSIPKSASDTVHFIQCIPEEFISTDSVDGYRKYYMGDRIRAFARWKNRGAPYWWV